VPISAMLSLLLAAFARNPPGKMINPAPVVTADFKKSLRFILCSPRVLLAIER